LEAGNRFLGRIKGGNKMTTEIEELNDLGIEIEFCPYCDQKLKLEDIDSYTGFENDLGESIREIHHIPCGLLLDRR